MNLTARYLWNKYIDSPDEWRPLIAFFYLTGACDFKCPYCATGPFLMSRPGEPEPILGREGVRSLLKVIRRHVDYVVITGGEPLRHPDFGPVLEDVKKLEFKRVFLATNGALADRHLTAIASAVDFLVVSLDTLDEKKGDGFAGCCGALRRVLANLDRLAAQPGRRYRISISSVITPMNIDDLYGVFEYTQERGFEFAAAPQLVGLQAHPNLPGSAAYRRFYDFLIDRKKKGARIHGTLQYLRYLRDLSPFRCRPFTMMVVSPTGELYYPCLEGGNVAANLLEEPDLNRIRVSARERLGPQPECGSRCHSACMLGFALAIRNPGSLFLEALLQGRAEIRDVLSSRF